MNVFPLRVNVISEFVFSSVSCGLVPSFIVVSIFFEFIYQSPRSTGFDNRKIYCFSLYLETCIQEFPATQKKRLFKRKNAN